MSNENQTPKSNPENRRKIQKDNRRTDAQKDRGKDAMRDRPKVLAPQNKRPEKINKPEPKPSYTTVTLGEILAEKGMNLSARHWERKKKNEA